MNKTERYLINFTFHINKLVKKQCKPKVSTRKEIIEIRMEINHKIEKKNSLESKVGSLIFHY